eukprot:2418393-Rhodomonas_salina.1
MALGAIRCSVVAQVLPSLVKLKPSQMVPSLVKLKPSQMGPFLALEDHDGTTIIAAQDKTDGSLGLGRRSA